MTIDNAVPMPLPPGRRPSLGERQGRAERLIREYASHELAEIRQAEWYAGQCSAFTYRYPSSPAPSQATMDRIADVGRILNDLRTIRPVHYRSIRIRYFDGGEVPERAVRAALDLFANLYEAWQSVSGPTNSL